MNNCYLFTRTINIVKSLFIFVLLIINCLFEDENYTYILGL